MDYFFKNIFDHNYQNIKNNENLIYQLFKEIKMTIIIKIP